MDFELMFCPYCGGDIDRSDSSKYVCTGCGKNIFTDRTDVRSFIRPGELEASFHEALHALGDDNPQKAMSTADSIIEASEGTDFDAFFLRGAVYSYLGEDGKAAMDWKRGLELLTAHTNLDAYICLMSRCISEMIYRKEEDFVEFSAVKYIDRLCDEIYASTGESCKSFFYYNVYQDYKRVLGVHDKDSDENFNEVVPKLFSRVVAYHRNLWCLARILEEYLASTGYDPETYVDDDLEDAHVYDVLARHIRAHTDGMPVEEMREIISTWDDEKLRDNEERLYAMLPHSEGMLGKLLSRKSDSEPVDLDAAAEAYVNHLLRRDGAPSEEPQVLE